MGCSGISAGWCPIHGDCICPVDERGEHITMDGEGFGLDNPDCPLHAGNSTHGDVQVISTIWGPIQLGDE